MSIGWRREDAGVASPARRFTELVMTPWESITPFLSHASGTARGTMQFLLHGYAQPAGLCAET